MYMSIELLVTREMLDNIKTDMDFFQQISCSKVRCEDLMVYDKLMDWFSQLHIATYGDRETLIIVA